MRNFDGWEMHLYGGLVHDEFGDRIGSAWVVLDYFESWLLEAAVGTASRGGERFIFLSGFQLTIMLRDHLDGDF